jgi:hypothetical protein
MLEYRYRLNLKVVPKNLILIVLLRIAWYYILVYNTLAIIISDELTRSILASIIYFDSINLEV